MKRDVPQIILLILLASCIVSIGFKFLYGYVLDYRYYLGSSFVLSALILRYVSKKVSEYILWVILILGTVNIITVSHSELTYKISMGELSTPGFNPLMLITLLLLYYATQKREESSGKEKISKEERLAQYEEERIRMYMKEHENKSTEDLEKIANGEGKYVNSAVIACQRLLNQKNENAL